MPTPCGLTSTSAVPGVSESSGNLPLKETLAKEKLRIISVCRMKRRRWRKRLDYSHLAAFFRESFSGLYDVCYFELGVCEAQLVFEQPAKQA